MTIKKIAEIAGVSNSTVSRSLNDSPLISDETKKTIKKIASQHDFHFNAKARGLRQGTSNTIGILYPTLYDDSRYSTYIQLLLQNIKDELETRGHDSIIVNLHNKKTGISNVRRLIQQQKVDGFIFVYASPDDEDMKLLSERSVPLVQVNSAAAGKAVPGVDYYHTDNLAGGKMATEFLLQKGIDRILCITLLEKTQEIVDRVSGYKTALEERGVSVTNDMVVDCDCTFEAAYSMVVNNKEMMHRYGGVFVHADIMALGVVSGLKDIGFNVPSDVKVIGYDDAALSAYAKPKLTTVHQPREEIARLCCARMAKLLMREVDGNECLPVEPYIVVRGTA